MAHYMLTSTCSTPQVQEMGMKELQPELKSASSQSLHALNGMPSFWVKQTRKGWLRELLGCEELTEFKIATMEEPQRDLLYSIEESPFLWRLLCAPCRPFKQTVSLGDQPGGPVIMSMHRPFSCLCHCQCCCHQKMFLMDGNNQHLGKAEVPFFCCVPVVTLHDQQGRHQYNIHHPTCCGGCCMDPCAEGCCNCKVPFYIYNPGCDEPQQHVGKIVKVWRGLSTELFTDADSFQLQLPGGATPDDKARLLASTMLINAMFFENKRG